jgi:hypothetical protein
MFQGLDVSKFLRINFSKYQSFKVPRLLAYRGFKLQDSGFEVSRLRLFLVSKNKFYEVKVKVLQDC